MPPIGVEHSSSRSYGGPDARSRSRKASNRRWDRHVLSTPGLGQDADPDVHPATGHRERPAIAGEERSIEPEHRLADVGVHARGIRPPGDRDVAFVVTEDADCRGHDRVDAVGTGDEQRRITNGLALASRLDHDPRAIDPHTGTGGLLVDGRPGRRGRVEHDRVEVLARHDVAMRAASARRGRRRRSARDTGHTLDVDRRVGDRQRVSGPRASPDTPCHAGSPDRAVRRSRRTPSRAGTWRAPARRPARPRGPVARRGCSRRVRHRGRRRRLAVRPPIRSPTASGCAG